MSKDAIDTFTAVLLWLAIALGIWFGFGMDSWLAGIVATGFLCGLALVIGGVLMYAIGPGMEGSRRFGQTTRDY